MSKEELDFGNLDIPGIDEAAKKAEAAGDVVDPIYEERPGDNDCSSGACAI